MSAAERQDRYSEAAISAAATLRWLENSGPRFIETQVKFRQYREDQSVVLVRDGQEAKYEPGDMSYASWYICYEFGLPGAILTLKLRTK